MCQISGICIQSLRHLLQGSSSNFSFVVKDLKVHLGPVKRLDHLIVRIPIRKPNLNFSILMNDIRCLKCFDASSMFFLKRTFPVRMLQDFGSIGIRSIHRQSRQSILKSFVSQEEFQFFFKSWDTSFHCQPKDDDEHLRHSGCNSTWTSERPSAI